MDHLINILQTDRCVDVVSVFVFGVCGGWKRKIHNNGSSSDLVPLGGTKGNNLTLYPGEKEQICCPFMISLKTNCKKKYEPFLWPFYLILLPASKRNTFSSALSLTALKSSCFHFSVFAVCLLFLCLRWLSAACLLIDSTFPLSYFVLYFHIF